ncbi:MAG: two-component system LytT family response regulator [Crocinitomix sp.]|jgi:two-component system LytT family response regulator
MDNPIFTAVIVDDEAKARENIKILIEDYCPEIELVNSFSNPKEGLSFLLRESVDLLFLDIRMPEMTGFELLENFIQKRPKTIIVSAHENYGIEAVKAGAFDYLLKPIGISDIRALVTRLFDVNEYETKSLDSNKISVPHGSGFKVVDLDNVMYIESDNSYCDLHIGGEGKLVVSCSIKEFERMLSNKGFFRIHNRYLINMKFLESFSLIDGGIVTLIDHTQLPVSRRKIKEFKTAVKGKYKTPK